MSVKIADVEVRVAKDLGAYRLGKVVADLVMEAKLAMNRDMLSNGVPTGWRITVERVEDE